MAPEVRFYFIGSVHSHRGRLDRVIVRVCAAIKNHDPAWSPAEPTLDHAILNLICDANLLFVNSFLDLHVVVDVAQTETDLIVDHTKARAYVRVRIECTPSGNTNHVRVRQILT